MRVDRSLPALAVALAAGVLAAGVTTGAAAQPASPQPKVLDERQVTEKALLDALTPSAEELEGIRTRSLRVGPAGSTGAAAAATGAANAGTAAAAGSPAAAGTAAAVAAPRRDVSLLVTFVTNSSTLTSRAQQLLDVVGRALKSEQLAGLKFTVEGHADPRGTTEHNLALSQARAESVRDYLMRAHGIAGERLVPVGKGESELLNRAQPTAPENRRVTLVTRME